MIPCLTIAAVVVAVAAAVRSTWSPCGLSMLSTITPLSEEAKGHSYRSTAGWFIIGAGAGGATLGGVMALVAAGLHALTLSPTVLGLVALVCALVAAGSDAGVGGWHLPIHRRQVNERWLDRFRAWVYGAGFGWQIGTGLTTYITTAAVYLMIVLGALTTRPLVALAVGTLFGLLRGAAVLLTRRLHSADRLLAFHRTFTAAGPSVATVVTAVVVGVALALTATLHSPAALALTAGSAILAVGLSRGRRVLAR